MDTPKRQVSFLELESFPPDIWTYFVCYLPGEQLGRLMMTGAKLLRQRLKFKNVIKSIKLGKDFLVFRSFPMFLSKLPSLEELSIHSRNERWSHELGLTIDSLPSGLRKLELSGCWDQSTSQLFDEPGGTLKFCDLLPQLETLDLGDLCIPDCSWMIDSPKSLTHLKLGHWNAVAALPSSLIHFETRTVELYTRSLIPELPPSLESFIVSGQFGGVDLVVPLLPDSVRKLSLGAEVKHLRFAKSVLEQLPKSLTWLKVPRSDFEHFSSIREQLCSLLPSTLTTFKIRISLPCSEWPHLPQQLTDLSISTPWDLRNMLVSKITDNHGIQHNVSTIPIGSLPRSITKLKLRESYLFCGPPPNASDQSYFPLHLTHLSMKGIQLSIEATKLLPESLTYLEIGNFCERVCEHLPSNLKTLISDRTLMSPSLINFLPKSLSYLHLSLSQIKHPWFDYNTGKSAGYLKEVSDFTIHERCTSNSFDWKDACPLPPTLTHFALYKAEELGDSFLKYQQLPNLLGLFLDDSKRFTDLSISCLSPSLTHLNLRFSRNITGESFPFLPRHLVYLNLENSESIFDFDIQYLPRTLKEVYFDSAKQLTELCIPDLPLHLEKLYLRFNPNITPSSFPYSPSPLQSSVFI